jgi:hypothetical protein
MLPLDRVRQLAAALRDDGLELHARDLEQATDGMFNHTEVWMTWCYQVELILQFPGLSASTKAKAQALFNILQADLS